MADTCSVGGTAFPFDAAASCCQKAACNIPCPSTWKPASRLAETYGSSVVVSIAIYCAIGFAVMFKVKGKVKNYFVAGRSLSLFVCTLALAGQSLDSNATLGNADLAYKFHYFDGVVLPVGLGVSLFLNGLLLARHINKAEVLTLPDFYARKYGKLFEVLVSLTLCTSFISLLAGNFVGVGRILQFCFGGMGVAGSVFLTAAVCASYTIGGGLYSVVYADVVQGLTGILGLVVAAAWMLQTKKHDVPTPSIGFPGYVYPNAEICAMYEGVVSPDSGACIYNEAKWGSAGVDNGAWPLGDRAFIGKALTSFDGLAPFPNSVFYNWATIVILGVGNLSALDFQARCMAAKTPQIATLSCILAGIATFIVGVPFAYLGGFARLYYGPDSPYAEFEADTCSGPLGLPSCGKWIPDESAFLKLVTNQFPVFLGCWTLIGIVAASTSTATGVLLAISTVLSHNVGTIAIKAITPSKPITQAQLMLIVRCSVPIVAIIAAVVASTYNETGYLIVVAFDIALAGTIAPLLASVYTPDWVTPTGGVLGLLSGILTRVILEYTLPKDGNLVLPYGKYSYDYGTGVPTALPIFVDAPSDQLFDPATCPQERLADWTGLDSLLSPVVCTLVLYAASAIELKRGKPLLGKLIPQSWLEPVPVPKNVDAAIDA